MPTFCLIIVGVELADDMTEGTGLEQEFIRLRSLSCTLLLAYDTTPVVVWLPGIGSSTWGRSDCGKAQVWKLDPLIDGGNFWKLLYGF